MVNREGRGNWRTTWQRYQNKAIALSLGFAGAVALCDQAIAIRERLVNRRGEANGDDLAMTYQNKATLKALGFAGAVALYDQAIGL